MNEEAGRVNWSSLFSSRNSYGYFQDIFPARVEEFFNLMDTRDNPDLRPRKSLVIRTDVHATELASATDRLELVAGTQGERLAAEAVCPAGPNANFGYLELKYRF